VWTSEEGTREDRLGVAVDSTVADMDSMRLWAGSLQFHMWLFHEMSGKAATNTRREKLENDIKIRRRKTLICHDLL
jgi:hypothetical protein